MWPWEHLAVAYLAYSVLSRLVGRRPTRAAVLALAFGSQLPDLIDKPLGWWLGVLPSGRSFGHSVFVAIALCVVVLLAGVAVHRRGPAVAFAVGYLSHLPADVGYPLLLGQPADPRIVLWPVAPVPEQEILELTHVIGLWEQYVAFLQSPAGTFYLGAEVALLLATVLLWRRDGYPGLPGRRRHRRVHGPAD